MKTRHYLLSILIATITIIVVGLNIYYVSINKKTEAATSVSHNINP